MYDDEKRERHMTGTLEAEGKTATIFFENKVGIRGKAVLDAEKLMENGIMPTQDFMQKIYQALQWAMAAVIGNEMYELAVVLNNSLKQKGTDKDGHMDGKGGPFSRSGPDKCDG